MATLESLLSEAEAEGIINIDANTDPISMEVIQAAIDATRRLNSRLDRDDIAKKLQEADRIVAAQHR